MKKINYAFVKKYGNKYILELNYKKLKGFNLKPKNNVEYDGITVNKMVVINQSFVEKIIKKKIKRKLDYYLNYIISLLETDNDEGDNLKIALNDLERYKRTIINTYRIYLEEKYTKLLLKKIDMLELELKNKLVYNELYYKEPVKEKDSICEKEIEPLEPEIKRSR